MFAIKPIRRLQVPALRTCLLLLDSNLLSYKCWSSFCNNTWSTVSCIDHRRIEHLGWEILIKIFTLVAYGAVGIFRRHRNSIDHHQICQFDVNSLGVEFVFAFWINLRFTKFSMGRKNKIGQIIFFYFGICQQHFSA